MDLENTQENVNQNPEAPKNGQDCYQGYIPQGMPVYRDVNMGQSQGQRNPYMGQLQGQKPYTGQQFQGQASPYGNTQFIGQQYQNPVYTQAPNGSYPNQMAAPVQEEPSKPKKNLAGLWIGLAAFVILAGGLLAALFMNIGPFKQTGGRASVADLMNAYVEALNKDDVEGYLDLIPKAERTDAERSYVTERLLSVGGVSHNYSITVGASKNLSGSKVAVIKDKLSTLGGYPVRVNSVQEVNITLSENGKDQQLRFTVIECGGQFFIDDIIEK